MKTLSSAALSLMCAVSVGAIASAAHAQTATEAAIGLEEVVVTAQRRQQNLQDVPIAVSAITATTATKLGVNDPGTLVQIVPGFTFNRQAGGALPFIRGVGNASSTIGNEPSVAFFVDDQYIPASNAAVFQFNNIDLVEVLKGPQGTLFGRNATGGVVHIHSRNPTYEPTADVSVGYGNYDTLTGQLYGSTKVTDTVAVNVAAFVSNQKKGWGRNVNTGADANWNESWGVRGKLLFEPSDDTSLLLAGTYNLTKSDQGMSGRIVDNFTGRGPFTLNSVGAGFYDTTVTFGEYYKTPFTALSGKLTHHFEHATVVAISAYSFTNAHLFFDLDAAPTNFLNADLLNTSKVFTQELQILSPDGSALQWIMGGFFLHEKAIYDATYTGGAFGPLKQTGTGNQVTDSFSGFAQVTGEILPRTNLTIGVRYTSDRRKLSNAGGTLGPLAGPPTAVAMLPRARKTFSNLSGRFSLDHKFTDDVMGYVAYNRGFKSGVFAIASYNNSSTAIEPAVNPEDLNAYSIGFKSQFMDRRLRFNAEAFYYDYSNIQVQNNLPTGGGSRIVNGGKARIKGIDAELTFLPVENLTLSANVSMVDGEFKAFPNGPTFFPQAPNAPIPIPAGCDPAVITSYPTATGPLAQRGCSLAGNKTMHTVPLMSNLSAIYTIESAMGSIDLAASWAHGGNYYFEPFNTDFVKQKKTNLINSSIKLTAPNGAFDLRLWVNNLTKEKVYSFISYSATSGPKGAPAAPRTYGLTVGAHF